MWSGIVWVEIHDKWAILFGNLGFIYAFNKYSYIDLTKPQGAKRLDHSGLCLWRCMWMSLIFELVDWVHAVMWVGSIQSLKIYIEQKVWERVSSLTSWAGTLVFLGFGFELKHQLLLGLKYAGCQTGTYPISPRGSPSFKWRLQFPGSPACQLCLDISQGLIIIWANSL